MYDEFWLDLNPCFLSASSGSTIISRTKMKNINLTWWISACLMDCCGDEHEKMNRAVCGCKDHVIAHYDMITSFWSMPRYMKVFIMNPGTILLWRNLIKPCPSWTTQTWVLPMINMSSHQSSVMWITLWLSPGKTYREQLL